MSLAKAEMAKQTLEMEIQVLKLLTSGAVGQTLAEAKANCQWKQTGP